MKRTTVINLFGAPGSGKSTTAAGLFYKLKQEGVSVELVQEYIKKWAYRGWVPTGLDDLYIFGKQTQAESYLYGKVDYIITDSPVYLSSFYEDKYSPKRELVKPGLKKFIKWTTSNGVVRKNFWLVRNKKYNPNGRYQTEKESDIIARQMKAWLKKHKVRFDIVGRNVPDGIRASHIKDLIIY